MKAPNFDRITTAETDKMLDLIVALTKDKKDPDMAAITLCALALSSFAHGNEMSPKDFIECAFHYYEGMRKDIETGQAVIVKGDKVKRAQI